MTEQEILGNRNYIMYVDFRSDGLMREVEVVVNNWEIDTIKRHYKFLGFKDGFKYFRSDIYNKIFAIKESE